MIAVPPNVSSKSTKANGDRDVRENGTLDHSGDGLDGHFCDVSSGRFGFGQSLAAEGDEAKMLERKKRGERRGGRSRNDGRG